MKLRYALLPLLAACAAAPATGAVGAEAMPPIVRQAIDKESDACRPDKVTLDQGFMTRKDVNGDGVPDYVLNYGAFRCGESSTLFCGSAGCQTQVFASVGGAFAKVFDSTVQEVAFKTVKGRPALLLGLHGSECGKRGADPCGSTLYWNGTKFGPAH